jgi:hypothetical protein
MIVLVPLLALVSFSGDPVAGSPAFRTAAAPVVDDDVPEMEYTYIEANYLWTDSDDADDTLGGWELVGSLELPLNFFGQISVSQQSDDADLEQYRIGAGYHLPLGARLDAFGILSFAHTEVDDSGNDFDDEGVAAELGGRFLVNPKLEVNGSVEWMDVEESETGVGFGARWYFIDALSLGGRIERVDTDESFSVGLRLEI